MTTFLKYIFIIPLFAFVAPAPTFAGSCDYLASLAKDPDLVKNEAFWEAYSKLGPDVSEESLKTLAGKFKKSSHGDKTSEVTKPSDRAQEQSVSSNSFLKVERKHTFTKSVGRFPRHIQKRADEFIEEISKPGGIHNLYGNPGRWHLEKLGDGTHSVRLNEGYRIKFETMDSKVILIDAGQHIYKH